MMKSAIFAAVCLVAVAAVSADTFTWSSSAGFFTVKDVAFRTPFNVPYGPGVAVECVISGRTTDVVTAGTVKFNLWEDDVAHFEDNGNLPYFHCNNKGCDSSSPIALFLDEPSAEATDYEVRFQFIMTEAQSSGDFHLVVFGQDQHHYPYDFSVTVAYNYTEAATAPQLTAPFALPKPSLRGAVEATPEAPQYQYNITNGNFTVDSLTFTSPDGGFTAGTVATVKMTGVIEDSTILAGTVKYKFYEFGAQHFVAGGNSPYFQCTNKGCDPADGVSLHLGSPTSVPTSFTLTLNVVLPKMLPGATNPFILEVWGVDQDHTPYDFVASIRYALSA